MKIKENKMRNVSLPSSLRLRPAKWMDLDAVAQLIYDVCKADGDTTVAVTPEELRHEWETAGFSLEQDTFLVETGDGKVVGFEEFHNDHAHAILATDGYVHPDFRAMGIGTTLLRAVENRACEEMSLARPDLRVALRSTIDNRDQASHDLHKNESYQPLRYHWRMEITLNGPPDASQFPAGIELRPFVKGEHDIAVWEAQNESFRDNWGSRAVTLEDWKQNRFDDPEFNPSLWVVAWDGNEVAGFSINRYRMGIGWIRTLGVRRVWRNRGLGLALLQQSFGEFYRRGKNVIGLGVDAQSPTGATRLYQKAGMYVASEFVTYEKELRSGREPENEE